MDVIIIKSSKTYNEIPYLKVWRVLQLTRIFHRNVEF